MKSKKIFCIRNLAFNLPDNFNGTLTDALELLLEYHKNEGIQKYNIREKEKNDNNAQERTLEDAVNSLWSDKHKKLYMEQLGLSFELSNNNINWKRFFLNNKGGLEYPDIVEGDLNGR